MIFASKEKARELFAVLAIVAPLTLLTFGRFAAADVPANPGGPTMHTTASADQLINEISSCHTQLELLLKGDEAYSDPVLRKAVSSQAIPLIKKMAEDSAILSKMPKHNSDSNTLADSYLVKESALGDTEASNAIDGLANSDNVDESLRGHYCQIWVRWMQAGDVPAAQTAVVDDLEKLDRANLDYVPLSALTLGFSMSAASPELKQRLTTLATKTMTATQTTLKNFLAAAAAHDRLLKSIIGKPLVIEGKTVEGDEFTSANWKGKVILVDFWATWCHYCVEQLPTLKQVYSRYHAQGFEVVGVSNDFQIEALQHFLADKQVAWPEMFDPVAAANGEHHEVAQKLHVTGIPQLFLIDRKGKVRALLSDPVDTSGKYAGPITPEELGGQVQKLLAEPTPN